MPGPKRLGSLAWKCSKCRACCTTMSGIGRASLDIALTSRCSRTRGEATISINLTPKSAVLRKFPSCGPSGSTANITSHASKAGTARLQHIGGEFHRLIVTHAGQQVALHGRAEHEDPAAQVAAQTRQLGHIHRGSRTHRVVGGRQMKAFGLRNNQCRPIVSNPAASICRRTSPRRAAERS